MFGMMLMALTIGTTFPSCEKEIVQEFPKMTLKDSGNEWDRLSLMEVEGLTSSTSLPVRNMTAYARLSFFGPNELRIDQTYIYNGRCRDLSRDYAKAEIVSVGYVNNLNDVNNVPSSGWTTNATVQVGHGYIIRFQSASYSEITFRRYARVYVESWDKGAEGDIIGVVVQYEDNWLVDY